MLTFTNVRIRPEVLFERICVPKPHINCDDVRGIYSTLAIIQTPLMKMFMNKTERSGLFI